MTAAASSAVALGLNSTGDGGGGGHCDRHHALYPLRALPAGTSPGPACTAWCTLSVPGWMPPSVTQPLQTDDEHEIIRG